MAHLASFNSSPQGTGTVPIPHLPQITGGLLAQLPKVVFFGKYSVNLPGFGFINVKIRLKRRNLMTIAYVSSPLDRAHQLRTDDDALVQLRASTVTALIRIHGESVEMADGQLLLSHHGIDNAAVFLGLDPDGRGWFATAVAESPTQMQIRTLMIDGTLDAPTLSILAQARSLVGWHVRHGFCASCGAKTVMQDAGYRRHCAGCSTDHFPRTDPVVIMAVTYKGKFLLGRQAAWPPHMFSALAGFVEPGETIEQAVRREVFEETAVRVGAVHYVASQPWPHPSSLMIGMLAEAETDTITIDPKELESARWFSRDELQYMLAGTHPDGLWASRPEAIAHLVLRAAVAP
jgi:NAD+ diphosphatase